MEIVYQSHFQVIKHDKLLRYFDILWNHTDQMEDTDYQTEMLAQVETAVKYKVHGYIVDSSRFYFTISPKIQEWTVALLPKLAQAGTRKVAFLVTPDIFAQVSIEQTMDEEETQAVLQSRYFDDRAEAKAWLTQDIKLF